MWPQMARFQFLMAQYYSIMYITTSLSNCLSMDTYVASRSWLYRKGIMTVVDRPLPQITDHFHLDSWEQKVIYMRSPRFQAPFEGFPGDLLYLKCKAMGERQTGTLCS